MAVNFEEFDTKKMKMEIELDVLRNLWCTGKRRTVEIKVPPDPEVKKYFDEISKLMNAHCEQCADEYYQKLMTADPMPNDTSEVTSIRLLDKSHLCVPAGLLMAISRHVASWEDHIGKCE